MPFNFIEKLLELTQIAECPTSFLEWSAYVALGGVMRSNVKYSFPARRAIIAPNLYVMVVGDSGATRKSTPLGICNDLLRSVGNTKLIKGRASIQGVMKELSAIKTIEHPIRRQLRDATAVIYSEEYASSLVRDPATSSILCDLYDFKEEHSIYLKADETVTLKNVCITLFSATNAAFIQDIFTKTDLYGGFVGRTFFVIEEKARHKDLGLEDSTDENEWQLLYNHLMYLSKIEGSVILDRETIEYLNSWYKSTDFSLYESKTGYEHRAHTYVLKLGLILAAAEEGFNRKVEIRHYDKAIDIVTGMRKNYHKLVMTAGLTPNSIIQATKDITVILFQNPDRMLSKDEILRRLFGRVDLESFDKAILTLDQTGIIEIGGGRVTSFGLSQKGREMILGGIKMEGKAN